MSQAVPSLYDFLGDLEDEGELQRAADHLTALREHPGFALLERMVAVQTGKLQVQFEAKPMRDVQTYAHGAGVLKGLKSVLGMVDKAIDAAVAERKRLEEKEQGGQHD